MKNPQQHNQEKTMKNEMHGTQKRSLRALLSVLVYSLKYRFKRSADQGSSTGSL